AVTSSLVPKHPFRTRRKFGADAQPLSAASVPVGDGSPMPLTLPGVQALVNHPPTVRSPLMAREDLLSLFSIFTFHPIQSPHFVQTANLSKFSGREKRKGRPRRESKKSSFLPQPSFPLLAIWRRKFGAQRRNGFGAEESARFVSRPPTRLQSKFAVQTLREKGLGITPSRLCALDPSWLTFGTSRAFTPQVVLLRNRAQEVGAKGSRRRLTSESNFGVVDGKSRGLSPGGGALGM